MEIVLDKNTGLIERALEDLQNASSLTRPDKALKFSSQLERFSVDSNGLKILLEYAVLADQAGYFEGTSWEDPGKLVPSLVRGTLMVGPPTSTMELMSELRILSIGSGDYVHPQMTKEEALTFLEEIIVHNLDIALGVINEEARMKMSKREIQKATNLFQYLLSNMPLQAIKKRMADEIEIFCIQRPVETHKTIALIELIKDSLKPGKRSEEDKKLHFFIDAAFHPSPLSKQFPDPEEYAVKLPELSKLALAKEAELMGEAMDKTGLVCPGHISLMLHIIAEYSEDGEMMRKVLALTPGGIAQWVEHKSWLLQIIPEIGISGNHQFVYGLSQMLKKALFSRRAVKAGLNNMRNIKIHPVVARQIKKSLPEEFWKLEVLPFVLSATIRILGQPLGVSQGNNPTCQSARGISLWSQHAPAKLIDMIMNVASQNRLIMRFETAELNSNQLGKGLIDKLDHDLDVVSAILVPHLDKIYNEMMRRASVRGEDPHKWVNPALYGQWIQTGFASAYDYLTNSIKDYNGFIRLFYTSFHPHYNGDKLMTYPCPLGIFITSSQAKMLGFHAISLLRVKKGTRGDVRAFFLNPNNEGRQDWGQGIEPQVHGNGEEPGESSLPFDELASRVYAFHYHPSIKTKKVQKVEKYHLTKVRELAENSWGKQYLWNDIPAIW
nr:hypothetical protein [Saprospiraceae bacterium]